MPENVIAVIAWLGISCFCGILPLAFAAILFFTARKRGGVGKAISQARQTKVAALQPGMARRASGARVLGGLERSYASS